MDKETIDVVRDAFETARTMLSALRTSPVQPSDGDTIALAALLLSTEHLRGAATAFDGALRKVAKDFEDALENEGILPRIEFHAKTS